MSCTNRKDRVLDIDLKLIPATLTFQAIRIYINDELNELNQVLNSAAELIARGARF